jgi:peptide/nickel transport system permease protein
MLLRYMIRRVLLLIPMFFFLSLISFAVIQLPPGSYLETYINNMERRGQVVDQSEIARLRNRWGLDRPWYVQYARWMEDLVIRGNWGRSMASSSGEEIGGRLVNDIIKERLPPTLITSFLSISVIWALAIPFGVYSATHQYSAVDYIGTVFSFIGLATPSFLLAVILMWFTFAYTGHAVVGLFSVEYREAPWSLAKVWDLMKNLWLPVAVLSITGTAGIVRVVRANLLDELQKQYVVMARSKGLSEGRLLWKYPIRIAFNPIFSTIGWLLPAIIGGEVLVSTVLNLPTIGPLLLRATLNQDMYLAGSILLILSTLTLLGTFLSDILLAIIDPRVRYE